MGYRAALFDFDYTLGDSTEGIVLAVNGALRDMGLQPAAREEIRKTIGLSMPETLAQLTGIRDGAQSDLFAALFKRTADRVMTARTELYPGAARLLALLKSSGVRCAIVTTKYHYRIDEILEKFKIESLVDAIVGGEDVKNQKPHPEPLLRALDRLGVGNREALYVGDSVVDAMAAQGAGIDFIAVTTGATAHEAFLKYPHRAIVAGLSELEGIILEEKL